MATCGPPVRFPRRFRDGCGRPSSALPTPANSRIVRQRAVVKREANDEDAPKAANRIDIFKEISARLASPHLARVRLDSRLAHPAQPSPQWANGEREGDGGCSSGRRVLRVLRQLVGDLEPRRLAADKDVTGGAHARVVV